MQQRTIADVVWEDPLSFKKLKEGDQVTLTSNSGIVADFVVNEIQSEAIILAPIGSKKKTLTSATKKSLVLSGHADFGGRKIRSGEVVLLQYKNFPPKKYILELNLNNNVMILKDPKASFSFLSTLLRLLK